MDVAKRRFTKKRRQATFAKRKSIRCLELKSTAGSTQKEIGS